MAKLFELGREAEAWLEARPTVIKEMYAKYPPNLLYRMQSTGHRVTLYSYAEDGTVTVNVTGQFNRVKFGRRVFGIPVTDLVECELPGPDEEVGEELDTPEAIVAYLNKKREETGMGELTLEDFVAKHLHDDECRVCAKHNKEETDAKSDAVD